MHNYNLNLNLNVNVNPPQNTHASPHPTITQHDLPPPSSDEANVLLIVVDQARPDAFGVNGNNVSYTPNFDKIATDGVHFSQAYTSTPICTPARQALLTGRSPWNHGMRCYLNQVTPTKYTDGWLELPTVMGDLGYYTTSVGKNHYGYNSTTMEWFTHGFDMFYPYEGDLSEDNEIKDKYVGQGRTQPPYYPSPPYDPYHHSLPIYHPPPTAHLSRPSTHHSRPPTTLPSQ